MVSDQNNAEHFIEAMRHLEGMASMPLYSFDDNFRDVEMNYAGDKPESSASVPEEQKGEILFG